MTPSPLGQVFTPPGLAELLWRHALAALGPVDGALRVIEPAAGDGALVRAGRRALRDRPVEGVAVELDPACLPDLRAAAEGSAGSWAVEHADALTLVGPDAPPSALGATCGAATPREVAARVPWLVRPGGADLVVANPPWVRETGHADLFRALRAWHGSHHADACPRNADLSHVFVAQIADWLRPGGVAAVLMPAYWMDTDVGRHVRARLASGGRVVAAWRAGEAHWFDGAAVEASFVIWQKGAVPGPTAVLAGDAASVDRTEPLPRPDEAWTLRASASALDVPTEPLGDHWRVIEGVSTAANRLRARDVDRVPGAQVGDGILVLGDDEVERLGLAGHPLLRRRYPRARGEWIVLARDRDMPSLDLLAPDEADEADEADAPGGRSPLAQHLLRFRPVLAARAEMRRNPSRSWYAVAWPRPELDVVGCVVTPKWSRAPAFAVLPDGEVPMTDQRVLVPRSPAAAAVAAGLVEWLNGDALAGWWQARARRRGAMMEFYGAMLATVPVPSRLVTDPRACSTR